MTDRAETPSQGQAQSRVDLAASTGDVTAQRQTSSADATETDHGHGHGLKGYFETAQWTADGTALLTSSSSNLVSGFIIPSDLLSAAARPLALAPQARIQLPEPSNVLAGAPYFRLAEPWTQQLLVSARDHPIQLFYLTSPSSPSSSFPSPASSYPLTQTRSETFLTASSLIWPAPGAHFVAGARNLLAWYDISRAEPVLRIKTIPSERHVAKGGGVGMRGTVSALGAQPPDHDGASLVAAGTWTRWVGLYDFARAGASVATWSIAHAAAPERGNGDGEGINIGGAGVTQTLWSPCGRYLLVSERKSAGILVYDVRVSGKLLGHLSGRAARGNQRIGCDVYPGNEASGGFEVWSGTTDGAVKVWEGVGSREGAHAPSWGWAAHEGSTVGSTCVHHSGSVVATCSGSWEFPDEDGDEGSEVQSSSGSSGTDNESGSESSRPRAAWMRRWNKESSLKIWSMANDGEEDERPLEDADGVE
ncbi:hypothetical protein AAE478_000650 [Parahypoxylon ruwenzoriense]